MIKLISAPVIEPASQGREVVLWMLKPFNLALVLCLATLAACNSVPPIAKSMVGPTTNSAFTERLRLRYPLGSPEAELMAELRREGFEIFPGRKDRFFDFSHVAHRNGRAGLTEADWDVYWRADEGRITAIWGESFLTFF